MSSAAVTPQMRAYGWNVYFLADVNAFHFSGVFQDNGNAFLTFRDVVEELRLCFELPDATRRQHNDDNDNPRDSWDDIAFGLINRGQLLSPSSSCPRLVTNTHWDLPVPSLPCRDLQERAVVRFHLVRHTPCNLPPDAPLDAHVKARCATHIPRPVRRPEPRYLPPKRPSPDAQIAKMPLRRTMRARTGSQSPKRRASGSVSPTKDKEGQQDEEDVAAIVAPPTISEINLEYARQTVSQFMASCLVMAGRCAVSGRGRSWCISPAVGPGLQACHIIPQQHYHLYPDPRHGQSTEYSARRLREAWLQTWSATNGLLLMSHLHEAFDARLFSIHPETLRVRAFVPYDVLMDYHGAEARVPEDVDRNALRHHYDMCCIENMAAKMPPEDLIAPPSASQIATSGTNSPFSPRSDLPTTPGPDGQFNASHTRLGDPSKRSRSTHDGPQVLTQSVSNSHEMDVREHKRRRVEDTKVASSDADETDWVQDGLSDSCITPRNSREFLADVNWELSKLTNCIE